MRQFYRIVFRGIVLIRAHLKPSTENESLSSQRNLIGLRFTRDPKFCLIGLETRLETDGPDNPIPVTTANLRDESCFRSIVDCWLLSVFGHSSPEKRIEVPSILLYLIISPMDTFAFTASGQSFVLRSEPSASWLKSGKINSDPRFPKTISNATNRLDHVGLVAQFFSQ